MTTPRYGRVSLSIAAIVASALGEPVPDRVPLNGEAILRPRLAGGGVEVGRGADGEEVQVPLPVSCQVLDGVLTQGSLPHVTLLVPTDAWYWQISFSDFAVGDVPILIEPFAFPVVEATASNLANDEFTGVNIAQFAASGWHSGTVPPAGSRMVAEMSELLVDARAFATQSEIRVNQTEGRINSEHEHVHQDAAHIDQVAAQVAAALDQANVFSQDQVPPYLQDEELKRTYQAKGTTAQRPTSPPVGMSYFDTTLGRPIWRKDTTSWVDATGTPV